MRLPCWLRFRRSLATALVGAALVGFVIANLGLPLIVPAVGVASDGSGGAAKDKSVPFPCQDRPCGCMSADACMRSCCCFTAEERLAWFRARNITPIPELIAAAKSEGHSDAHGECVHCVKVEQKPAARGCCTTKQSNPAVCDAQAVTVVSAVNSPAVPVDESLSSEGERKGWRVVIVIGSFAAKCHGMGPWSVTGVLGVPPSAEVTYTFDWSSAGDVTTVAPRLLSAIHSPPTRPPCC
jgi:hypothetical protein